VVGVLVTGEAETGAVEVGVLVTGDDVMGEVVTITGDCVGFHVGELVTITSDGLIVGLNVGHVSPASTSLHFPDP